MESFDYPGDYLSESPGKIVTRMRQRQERGADRRNQAVGDCVSLASGQRVKLGGDKVPGHGETYLCLSATHRFVSESYGSGREESDGYSYSGSWVLMPDTAPMVPPKRTPLAVVQGPQTAMVVGEGEIDCDEFGRILVQFHWDLENAYSMRCRVSQNWSGNGWGGMVIPRIGMEVVVEFLEGDPDKPLVTGNVFNGRNNVPYKLPKHKTRATWRSKTHTGGLGGDGFNELRFEDQMGEEEIRIHAEKDYNSIVKNDRSSVISRHSVDTVKGNRLSETLGNTFLTSFGGINIISGPEGIAKSAMLGFGNLTNTVSESAKNLTLAYIARIRPGDINMTANLNFMTSADYDRIDYAGRTFSRMAGEDLLDSSARNYQINVGKNRRAHIKGNDSTTVEMSRMDNIGVFYDLKIGEKGVIRSGESRIEISDDGTILISGSNIEILGSNSVKIKSPKIELN